MNKNKRFFSKLIPMTLVFGSLFLICDVADAATRASARSTPTTRKNTTTTNTTKSNNTATNVTANATAPDVAQKTETVKEPVAVTKEEIIEPEIESETFFEEYEQPAPEIIISNKSNQFEDVIGTIIESAGEDNSFAEQIRKQRAALAASEASISVSNAQRTALSTNSHVCDVALRKCMMEICDKDFTKCALDGDTDFGDKLNKCRNGTECSAEEFSLFAKEIKSDRDMNVRLASYNAVIDCGNNYNACIVNECGTTYSKCLGKSGADAAIKKCSVVARECSESDSGLAARFGTAIGKLRENAEKDVKTDENRLYTLRELMRKSCQSIGAMFDERSFDCVYSIEFYAGSDQSTPMASRKAYAGDSFVCTQEWFGINTTTAKENAYRETRSQTAASSAMLGSGVGMAAGLISSGAINRAIDTQKAKKDYKAECLSQGGTWKNGKCTGVQTTIETETPTPSENTSSDTPSTPRGQTSTNLSGVTTSNKGCLLKFDDDTIISKVKTIKWAVDSPSSMYDRDVDDVKYTNHDHFTIKNRAFNIIGYRTLENVVSVNGETINVPKPNTTTTYEMIFNCEKWNNGSYIGFDCKQGYKNGKKIGRFQFDMPGDTAYRPDNYYDIYDECK